MSGPTDPPSHRPAAARFTRAAGEAVLCALVVLSPWPFASNAPPFEFFLSAGVLLLTALWAADAVLSRRLTVRPDVVTVCLAGLVLLSAAQLVPLPEAVVGVVSPARLAWHRELLPAEAEVLPGEAGPVPRPTFLPLTVAPSATRTFLARVVGVLLVYAAARNWLATRESLPRQAWAAAGNGVALAVFALGQWASSPPGVMFWTWPVAGDGAFGPFVCRNHYPDYVALCAGLAGGLAWPRRAEPGAPLLTARAFGLAAATGLMLASVPFSLSRGGGLAVLGAAAGVWLLTRVGEGGSGSRAAGRFGLAAAVAVGAVAVSWLGSTAVEKRFATLATGEAVQNRLPLWKDSLKLAPGFWAAGTGGGTFVWAEPTVRSADRQAMYYYENAHNEYLEALVEGGVVRLALTAGLAAGVLVVVGRGYLRRRTRSVGPLLLGSWFGLAVVVFHAAGDFGVHMPAVAVAAAAVAGYAVAAAADPEFTPARVRRRTGKETGRHADGETGAVSRGVRLPALPPPPDRPASLSPPLLVSLSGLLVLAALAVAADALGRDRAARLRAAADATYHDADAPDRLARRAGWLDAAADARPDDPDALFAAAQGHIDAAVEMAWAPGAGLAGGAAGFSAAPDRLPPVAVDRHLVPALRRLREARAANPIAPKPHARLGLYAGYFRRAEPAAVHFERACRLLPSDPDVWYAAGREAFARGDVAAAAAAWRHSLGLSPAHLRPILAAARVRLSPAEVRDRVLPPDPGAYLAAADVLYPDRDAPSAERRMLLVGAVGLVAGKADPTPGELANAATAEEELGRPDEAEKLWLRAVNAAPDRADVRDRFAGWLEREERYGEAVPHLEWLLRRRPGDGALQDRLDAARHAVQLKKDIEG